MVPKYYGVNMALANCYSLPINSAIALKGQVWLVLFECKNLGDTCKIKVNNLIHAVTIPQGTFGKNHL